jgi:hypothetical protein
MEPNPNDRIALNPVVVREDRTLTAVSIAITSVSCLEIVRIAYAWHSGTSIDTKQLTDIITPLLEVMILRAGIRTDK